MEGSITPIFKKLNFQLKSCSKNECSYGNLAKSPPLLKVIFLLFPLVFFYQYCLSQSRVECEGSGIVQDSLNQTISYATVQLINITDSFKLSYDLGRFSLKM